MNLKRISTTLLGVAICVCQMKALPGQSLYPKINVKYVSQNPILDGVINPSEYGPGLYVDFTGDTNPGRFAVNSLKTSADPSDLSYTMYAAHTASTLYLAYHVNDQFIDAQLGQATFHNDCVELFFDADHVANDFVPYRGNFGSSREGFQLLGDAAGQQLTVSNDFHNNDWQFTRKIVPGGYVTEFAIPLNLMDKVDGAGYAAVTTGDHVNFNLAIDDNDRNTNSQDSQAGMWIFGPSNKQVYWIGEDGWPIDLYIAPKAVPEPSTMATLIGMGVFGSSLLLKFRRK